MATFPSYDPLVGASKRSQPSVRNVQFGDGYGQKNHVWLESEPQGVVIGLGRD